MESVRIARSNIDDGYTLFRDVILPSDAVLWLLVFCPFDRLFKLHSISGELRKYKIIVRLKNSEDAGKIFFSSLINLNSAYINVVVYQANADTIYDT